MISFEDSFPVTFYFFYDFLHPFYQFRDPLTGWRHTGARLQQGFMFASLIYMIFAQILRIYIEYSQTKDIVIVTENLAWIIVGLISLEICGTLKAKSKDIINILEDLKANYSSDEDLEKKIPMSEIQDEVVKISQVFQRSHATALTGQLLVPVVTAIFGYFANGTWEFTLPFHVWYPIDPKNPFVAPFLYLFECWGSFVSTGPMVGICAFVGGIVCVICVQFMELAHDFKNLNPRRGNLPQDTVKLIRLVKRHLRLIELSDQMKEIFSDFFLRNYVLSSVGISVFMFVTVTSTNTLVIGEYISDSICFTMYIATLSLFGHRLIEHSSRIPSAIYEGEWLEADPKFKSLLLMVMRRCRVPQFLTGRGFFIVSFVSLSKILTSSYSYFTLLKTSYTR